MQSIFSRRADTTRLLWTSWIVILGTTMGCNSAPSTRAGGSGGNGEVAPHPWVAKPCSSDGDCVTYFCVDGICCDKVCDDLCMACTAAKKGHGYDGVCGPINNGKDPDNECIPGECNGAAACKDPQIPRANGEACHLSSHCASSFCVDGVCCDTACTELCQSCSAAKKGSGTDGTCGYAKYDTDPDADCYGTDACSGAGTCQKQNGVQCTSSTECFSGYCVDGYCCTTACTGLCQSCNPNVVGIHSYWMCKNIEYNNDPDEECATGVCSGMGTCIQSNGFSCTAASDCLSNHCVDGVCCDDACADPCYACSAAKKGQGADGACGAIADAYDPDEECDPGECNGAGICNQMQIPQANGAACTNPWQCTSGFCVDGVCCNAVCSGTCVVCTATGSVGTCTPIPSGQNDPNGTPACYDSCNGDGACIKDTGAPCTTGNECVGRICDRLVCKAAQPGDDLLVWRTIWELPQGWAGPYPYVGVSKIVATDSGGTFLDGWTACFDQSPCTLDGGFLPSGVPLVSQWDGSWDTYQSFWQRTYKTGPGADTAWYQQTGHFTHQGNWGNGSSDYIAGNRAGRKVHIAYPLDLGPQGTQPKFGSDQEWYGPALVRVMPSFPNEVRSIPTNIKAPIAYGPSLEVYSIALSGGLTIYKNAAGGGATTSQSIPGSFTSLGFDVDSAGNLLIAFSFTGSVDFGAGLMTASATDLGLVKLDPNGNVVWQKQYPGSVDVTRLVAGENGFGVLGTGDVNLGYGLASGSFVARFDSQGTGLWHANPGGVQDTNNSGAAFGAWSAEQVGARPTITVEKYKKCENGLKCKREGGFCMNGDQCGSGFCIDGICR